MHELSGGSPVVPPAGSPAGSPAGGVTTKPSGAMHCPFWQVPRLQGVPKALGLILPALQRFSPSFRSHLPR